VALLPSLNQVSGVLSVGTMDCSILQESIQMATGAAQNLHTHSRQCLIDRLSNDSNKNVNQDKLLMA